MDKQNLYFIALIPPIDVSDAITKFKEDFSERFSSHKALKVMPHITLKAPFMLPDVAHKDLLLWFKKLFIGVDLFTVELNNFAAFHNKYNPVVFINCVMNTGLYSLQNEIIRSFKTSFWFIKPHDVDLKFKPHMTVAYRDLSPEAFQKAWVEYKAKEYKAVFEVKEFYLLQHNTRKWDIIATYPLTNVEHSQ